MQPDKVAHRVIFVAGMEESAGYGRKIPRWARSCIARASQNRGRAQFIRHHSVIEPGVITQNAPSRAALTFIYPPRHLVLMIGRPDMLRAAEEPQIVHACHPISPGLGIGEHRQNDEREEEKSRHRCSEFQARKSACSGQFESRSIGACIHNLLGWVAYTMHRTLWQCQSALLIAQDYD